MTNFLAPFLIGLAGSLHCIGMCSPLVVAASRTGKHVIFRNLQYNFGRILTYAFLGSLFSFAGRGLYLVGLQQWISIGAGIVILLIGITSVRVAPPGFIHSALISISNVLKAQFRRVINTESPISPVALGMINGLLPCGMTLVALGYCVTLTGPMDGFVAMTAFGFGTLPAMVGFAAITRVAITKLKVSHKRVQSALMILSAVILIGRGVLDQTVVSGHSLGHDGIVVCGGK